MPTKNQLIQTQQTELLETLKTRFHKNKHRHKNADWEKLQTKLLANPEKLWSLHQMETTGGEPDVIDYNSKTDTYTFFDCVPESPKDRRSLCYDAEALQARKENKPKNSAMEMASQMGIILLTEAQYKILQNLGEFDLKTSSWLHTPAAIRQLGGAIFGDRRYNHVFTYHNGASSYYAARGFRGCLKV
ncbi:DUF4256 domain-containing protein [Aequorivita echinoideorum]|uniref:DUF4256 domain-containing protein n=1 Tax=Aequorivita echinoideorum TaxID=1549647 RepID=A0ABS5S0Q4_9FLAO|nr:DUF4256 domain-containing protein [Aequorivita echinoideorum]MBT0606781.1 DUF4256 domain-containing protein [Aequorivita echinoideorum]